MDNQNQQPVEENQQPDELRIEVISFINNLNREGLKIIAEMIAHLLQDEDEDEDENPCEPDECKDECKDEFVCIQSGETSSSSIDSSID